MGTLSPVRPSVLLSGGARGDRGAECVVCVFVCKRDTNHTGKERERNIYQSKQK